MTTRILHTSDWHLGAELKGVSRSPEHRRFLDWLFAQVQRDKPDGLLVAGVVYHQAKPRAEAQQLYYAFLARLLELPKRPTVVVIAGNHDSAARLEAPRELLASLKIHVVGSLPPERVAKSLLVPIGDDLVVAAIPYVSEYHLGVRVAGVPAEEVGAALRDAFATLYGDYANLAEATYPGRALVAMGHLPCGTASDVMGWRAGPMLETHLRESVGALPPTIFDARYAYVALGHIHDCVIPDGHRVWYPGSPLPLRVSERENQPRLLIADFDADEGLIGGQPRGEPVPRWRKLLELRGSSEELRRQLGELAATAGEPDTAPFVYATVEGDAPPEFRRTLADELGTQAVLAELSLERPKDEQPKPAALPDLATDPQARLRQVFVLRHRLKHGRDPSPALLAEFETVLAAALKGRQP